MQNAFQTKQEICDIGYRIWQRMYCAGNEGNHSVRISEDRVLCTPTGVSKGFLKPEMVCMVDMDGKQIDTNNKYKRTSEILIHLEVYKIRPDVKAVVHSHPPHATAFALAGMDLPEGIHPEAEVFLGKVPLARFGMPATSDLADSLMPFLHKKDVNSILMGNHGVICYEQTLEAAYYKLEILDSYARLLLLSHQVGKGPQQLSKKEMQGLLQLKSDFGMVDSRLSCVGDGCIHDKAHPFLTPNIIPTPSAVCQNGGEVCNATSSDPQMEQMIQLITDQVMKQMGR